MNGRRGSNSIPTRSYVLYKKWILEKWAFLTDCDSASQREATRTKDLHIMNVRYLYFYLRNIQNLSFVLTKILHFLCRVMLSLYKVIENVEQKE